jgi:hypothetical protein
MEVRGGSTKGDEKNQDGFSVKAKTGLGPAIPLVAMHWNQPADKTSFDVTRNYQLDRNIRKHANEAFLRRVTPYPSPRREKRQPPCFPNPPIQACQRLPSGYRHDFLRSYRKAS